METGKPGCALVNINSAAPQTEKRMDVQAPLTAVYFHAVPAQPYPQLPAAAREPATLHLAMPLTLHIAGGLQSPPGVSLTASTAAPAAAAKPKSAGKHVCPHCGRDCLKPSVLEKHLRCHTGERPYPCTTCGVSFKTQSNLYKHKRTQAHARLSSESEQSSMDSMSSSRDTQTSSLSLDDHSEELLGSMEKDVTVTAPAECATRGSDVTSAVNRSDSSESAKVRKVEERKRVDGERPPSRHLPLQRQEATLFSKQWETSVSRAKSQSHESTDSGFSESSDHHSSPGSVLREHSMDSLAETSKEHPDETVDVRRPSEPGHGGAQEPKETAREQEQKTLEERISKLISQNSAVVEDKQLENVRPRKTVLSKQGSIDLPMPYTYKDSFHFDMRISKNQNTKWDRNRKPGLYCSVPTQQSTTTEHAPLTRSNSLPFSVTLLQPECSSPASSLQRDYVTLVRRGSSGQVNPAAFTVKPANQQSSTHRPLVRQTAVDCNHAADALFRNSSVEEAGGVGSLSCDGSGDACGEPGGRKLRRKKSQKFAYNKWYMYGGGTFKKLYSAEKGTDNVKGRKCVNPNHEGAQKRLAAVSKESVTTGSVINMAVSRPAVCHPGCAPVKLSSVSSADSSVRTNLLYSTCSSVKPPIQRNLSLSALPLLSAGSLGGLITESKCGTEAETLVHEDKCTNSTSQLSAEAHVPSDRKKQRTDSKIMCQIETGADTNAPARLPPSAISGAPPPDTRFRYFNLQKHQEHTELNTLSSPRVINANGASRSNAPATSTHSVAKTSFLPKYQLKLPNAVEQDSNAALLAADRPAGAPVSASPSERTSPSITTPVTSPPVQTSFSSAQAQFLFPSTATTPGPAATSQLTENVTLSQSVVHEERAEASVNTTQDIEDGLTIGLTQPSKSAPVQPPKPAAPAVGSFTAATTTRTQTFAAAGAEFSQCHLNSNPPLGFPAPDQLNPTDDGRHVEAPCHIVPFDQGQPTAHNVFHVHTADLQICLQIISDEQLALIEPQIERHVEGGLSPAEVSPADGIQEAAQSCVITGSSSDGGGHVSEALSTTRNTETIKAQLSDPFGEEQTDIYVTQPNANSIHAPVPADSKAPEAAGLMLHPHKCSHVTETLSAASAVVSTAASLLHRGPQSGSGLSLSVSRCGTHCSQHEINQTCRSPNSVNQNITRSELRGEDGQQKPDRQGASCNEEAPTPPPIGPHKTFGVACADELPVSPSSISKRSQLSNPPENALSEYRSPHRPEPHATLDTCVPLPRDPRTAIQSSRSEGQTEQITAVSEKPKDVPAVPASTQGPPAGVMAADRCGCGGQTDQTTWEPAAAITGQSESTDRRLTPSQETGGRTHPRNDGGVERGDQESTQPGNTTRSISRSTCLTEPQGEDAEANVDSLKDSRLSEPHLSQTRSGMSEHSAQSLGTAHNPSAPPGVAQRSPLESPRPPAEVDFHFLQNSHLIKTKAKAQDQEQASSGGTAGAEVTLEAHVKTPPTSRPCPVPHSHQVSRSSAPAVPRNAPGGPTKPRARTEAEDQAPGDYATTPGGICGRTDLQPADVHGCPAARPVPSCLDDAADGSGSSDDEGKLIIEL